MTFMPDIVPDPNLKINKFEDIKIQLPMMRRVFPELITAEICGVQPMSAPVGLAFALRYKYGQIDESRIPILIFEHGQSIDPFKLERGDLVLQKNIDGTYSVIKTKFEVPKVAAIFTEQQLKDYMAEHFEDVI